MADQLSHINQQRSTIQKLTEENIKLKAANIQMERDLQSQNQQIDNLIRDQHKTIINLNQTSEVLSQYKVHDIQVRQSSQKTDKLRQELDDMLDENHKLTMQIKQLNEDHSLSMMSLSDQLKDKDSQIKNLQSQNFRLQESLDQQKDHDLMAMNESLQTYKARLEAAVGKVEEYQQMVVKETSIGRSEKVRADEAEKSLESLREQFGQMESALSKQIQSLKEQLEI